MEENTHTHTHTNSHKHTHISIVLRTLIGIMHSLAPSSSHNHHNSMPNPNLILTLKISLNPQTAFWICEDHPKRPHNDGIEPELSLITTNRHTHKHRHTYLLCLNGNVSHVCVNHSHLASKRSVTHFLHINTTATLWLPCDVVKVFGERASSSTLW